MADIFSVPNSDPMICRQFMGETLRASGFVRAVCIRQSRRISRTATENPVPDRDNLAGVFARR